MSQLTKSIPHIKRILGLLGPDYAPRRVAWENGVQYTYDIGRALGVGVGAGRNAQGTASVAAVAAQFSFIQLNNELTSGRMAFLERVLMFSTVAARVIWERNSANLGVSIGATQFNDELGSIATACTFSGATSAVSVVTPRGRVSLLANETIDVPIGILMPPGDGVVFELETINLAFFLTAFWREETL